MKSCNLERRKVIRREEAEKMPAKEILDKFSEEIVCFFQSDLPWQMESAQKNSSMLREVILNRMKK